MTKKKTKTKAKKKVMDTREKLFVAYLIADPDHDVEKAALDAGYAASTAISNAYQWTSGSKKNSTKPHVWQAYQSALEKIVGKLEVSRERLELEYARLALLNPKDFYDKTTGALLPIHDMPEDAVRCLTGTKTKVIFSGKGSEKEAALVTEVKYGEKKPALDSLAKFMGYVTERKETTTNKDGTKITETITTLSREELMKIAAGEKR
jgi:phage terminase small subunit